MSAGAVLRRIGLFLLAAMLCLSHGSPVSAAPHDHDRPGTESSVTGYDLVALDDHDHASPSDDGQGDAPHLPGHLHLCAGTIPDAPQLARRLPSPVTPPATRGALPLGSLATAPPVQPPAA